MKRNDFDTFAQLRQAFPHADQVGKLTVFNIGDNKARLIAAIHYNRRRGLYQARVDPRRV